MIRHHSYKTIKASGELLLQQGMQKLLVASEGSSGGLQRTLVSN
jgi:hypothetical protein